MEEKNVFVIDATCTVDPSLEILKKIDITTCKKKTEEKNVFVIDATWTIDRSFELLGEIAFTTCKPNLRRFILRVETLIARLVKEFILNCPENVVYDEWILAFSNASNITGLHFALKTSYRCAESVKRTCLFREAFEHSWKNLDFTGAEIVL